MSMNPLNWLSFYNEEKQEGENLDNSLLVPLTVGLVSVVSSVLVGYRSGLLSRKQATSLIVKHVEEAQQSGSLTPPREMTKRKSTAKSTVKPVPISPHTAAAVASTIPDRTESVPDKPIMMKPHTKPADPEKGHSMHTASVVHETRLTDAPVESDIALPVAAHRPPTTTKRSKKPKQSQQHRTESDLSQAHSPSSPEADPTSWVVVTSKRVKQSTVPVSSEHSNSKASKKKHKGGEGSSETKPFPNGHPSVLKVSASSEPSAVDSTSFSTSEDRKPSVSFDIPADEKVSKPPKSKSSGSTNVAVHGLEQHPVQSVAPSTSVTGSLASQRTAGLEQHQHHSNVSDLASPIVPCQSSLPVNSAPAVSNPQLSKSLAASPAARELVTQHLSAQISAKELECQLLRDEVIRLREEVNSLKCSTVAKSHVSPVCSDVETMTDIPEASTMVAHKSKVSQKSPSTEHDNASSNTPTASKEPRRSNSPDSVLLITLQNEIARLAKEMKLSKQRNENMEARLAAANKQISASETHNAEQLKVLHQELETQTQRAQQSEDAQHRLENELREVLQQLECTRRKAEDAHQCSTQQHNELELARRDCATLLAQQEQWERERAMLVNEKDQLTRERETLASTHQACLSELENLRHASDELRVTIREAELRAQTLERDRSVVLGESHSRIVQLEAQLAASHEQAQAEHARLQTVESDLARLTKDTEQLTMQLTEKERELADWREKCTSLSQNLSELSERHHQSTGDSGSITAETIQSVSDSQPIAGASLALLDTTTQTDPEPGAEFESETMIDATGSHRSKEFEISDVRTVAVSPVPSANSGESAANQELEAQVIHYKAALDATEAMLSKLQNSVDEEEQRWRKALDASRMECEVLEEKLNKLETSLSMITQERDGLSKKLTELQNESTSNLDRISLGRQSIDDDRSSVSSLTVAHMLDTVRFDEATSKPELIRLLNKFRYLVQIEHEALKKEQSTASRLQSQLDTLQRQMDSKASVPESVLNGSHFKPSDSELPKNACGDLPAVDSHASDDSPLFNTATSQSNHANPNCSSQPTSEDSVPKSLTENRSIALAENQDNGTHGVVNNGLHSAESVNGDSVA